MVGIKIKNNKKIPDCVIDTGKWVKIEDDCISINTKPFPIEKSILNQIMECLRDNGLIDEVDFVVEYPEEITGDKNDS